MDNITGLFREDAIRYDSTKGPSANNPGGGLATKHLNLVRAIPNIKMVTEASEMGKISLVDVLYFSGGGTSEERDRRIEDYRNHNGFKILWTSDFEILRWKKEHREQVLDSTDIVAGNSVYMYKMLKGYLYDRPVVHLTDPIDTNRPNGELDRENKIYACSQILIEKGIPDVISLYQRLSNGSDKEQALGRIFIGSVSTWGVSIRESVNFNLELLIEDVSSNHYWSLPPSDVMAISNTALLFVSFARFETFGYAMVEAMLGGCHVFAGNHLAYKHRADHGVITISDSPAEMQLQIRDFLENNDPKRNDAAIQYVNDHYSLDVFKKQLVGIIGDVYGIR